MSKPDTRERILDAAEQLIAENGIGSTSLRHIIAAAEVNLAAVHYHFGSKQALVEEVYARHIKPVNRERLSRLEALKMASRGEAVELEALLDAFLCPIVLMEAENPERKKLVKKLFGRIHAESGEIREVILGQFREVLDYYIPAFRKALPHLPPREVIWRFQFMMGSMFMTMIAPPEFSKFTRMTENNHDTQLLLKSLVAFTAAGFRAEMTLLAN